MDPIGFTFEHYDAAGRWRDIDGGQPVDATGMLTGTDVDGALDGVPSLATRLGGSAQVADCAATQWFRYAFGRQEVSTGDVCTIGKLASALRRRRLPDDGPRHGPHGGVPKPTTGGLAMSRHPRTARPLSRRTILRGAGGAAIALPWLEAMTPAARARRRPARPNGSS